MGPEDVEVRTKGRVDPLPEGLTVSGDGERDPFLAPRDVDGSLDDLYDGDW